MSGRVRVSPGGSGEYAEKFHGASGRALAGLCLVLTSGRRILADGLDLTVKPARLHLTGDVPSQTLGARCRWVAGAARHARLPRRPARWVTEDRCYTPGSAFSIRRFMSSSSPVMQLT